MKYAVISDIHGNMDALDAVLSDAEKQSADIFLFAGGLLSEHAFS